MKGILLRRGCARVDRLHGDDQLAAPVGGQVAEVAHDTPCRQPLKRPAMARQVARQQLPSDLCVRQRRNEGRRDRRRSAGLLAACEMAGGTLTIEGDVGDHAASSLPGSMDGMRGGTLIVRGRAGHRFADRMRRGSALVFGDVGDFLASRLVAGTIAIGGQAGAHVGYGMRRGSVVFAGNAPLIAPTFVPALADAAVAWQLLARDLARHGGPFSGLPQRRIVRQLGDLAADGRGELILAA